MCICSFLHSCIAHVENVAQDLVAAEVEEEGEEGQEELYQELEVAEPVEEPFSVSDLANSESQTWFLSLLYRYPLGWGDLQGKLQGMEISILPHAPRHQTIPINLNA